MLPSEIPLEAKEEMDTFKKEMKESFKELLAMKIYLPFGSDEGAREDRIL